MFLRKGQALGSVNFQRLAELRAERPTKKTVRTTEPVAEIPVTEVQTAEPEPEPKSQEPEGRPKDYAPKPDWVAWAVTEGADEAEAEALTKNELIELYGGEE